MKEYNRLIKILKTNPDVKKDLEELRFGSIIKGKKSGQELLASHYDLYGNLVAIKGNSEFIGPLDLFEIIGNPLGYNHLLWFCIGEIFSIKLGYDNLEFWTEYQNNGEWYEQGSCEINYTKPFHQQEEEVYKQIADFLENNI